MAEFYSGLSDTKSPIHWWIITPAFSVMDVVFHDDLMRLRTKNGPQNMATIRHTALNIIKTIPGKESLKVKRKSTAWNEDKLMAAIKKQTSIIFKRLPCLTEHPLVLLSFRYTYFLLRTYT